MASIHPDAPSIDQSRSVCLVLGDDGTVLWSNAGGRRLGRSIPGVLRNFTDFAHPDHESDAKELLDEARGRGHAQRTLRVQDAANSPCYLHLMLDRGDRGDGPGRSMLDAHITSAAPAGMAGQMVVQGWDVSHLIERQQELELHAFRDPLTGVPNRLAFMARLDQELGISRLPRHQVAVLFADVDDFKLVNDTYGHETGDRVLTELAVRLSGSVRPGDLLGRIGGDEFAVICPDLIGWPAASAIIDRLRHVAAQPLSTPMGEVSVTISLGAAFAEESGGNPDAAADLVARADQRMFRAKPGARLPGRGNVSTVVT